MKFSLFTTLVVALMVAFTSASAGTDILKDVDTKDIKKDVLDDVKRDLDNCEKDEDNRSDFIDCVKDQLNDYDHDELSSHERRDIKSAAKDYDFKSSRNGRDGRDGRKGPNSRKDRRLLRSTTTESS